MLSTTSTNHAHGLIIFQCEGDFFLPEAGPSTSPLEALLLLSQRFDIDRRCTGLLESSLLHP